MQSIRAIAWLTWKAAFRFKLFVLLTVLLLGSVVLLPMLIKDDGTARGFTQILITYTLTTISALLGLSTLWLACGTLARDIEEATIQMVVVKPVARWQIWLGKWLGLVMLNAALIAITGTAVFVLLHWRARDLPEEQQRVLFNEVLVSRGVALPPNHDAEIEQQVSADLKKKLAENKDPNVNLAEVRRTITEMVKAEFTVVPPGAYRRWTIPLGFAKHSLQGQPLFLRIKFNAAEKPPSGTLAGLWQVGVPEKTKLWRSDPMSLAPDTFHEFEIPPDLFESDGTLTVWFLNANETTVVFPLEDGMEVLYREGGFLMNFLRGLAIILCWMALLAALGLMAASFLSFPVAAFFSLALLTLTFSTSTLTTVVEERSILGYDSEAGTYATSPIDWAIVPTFRALLSIINLAKGFSPVDALSVGHAISWGNLGRAVLQIVLLLGGMLAVLGITFLNRRELATAQSNH